MEQAGNDQLRFHHLCWVTEPVVKEMKFAIVCDSAADLPGMYTRESGVSVVPFYVSMDGENYLKEGVDISISDFYQIMSENEDCFPKTSMPSVQDYIDTIKPLTDQGMPVLCICLTKKFSGSLQSAVNAKMEILEENSNADIEVMDSELVTALEGMLVKEAVRLRDMDMEMREAVSHLEKIRGTGEIFFTTKDLKYLEHGGRLGKVSSIAGSVLNLKPLLHFRDGELGRTEVCRGRKKSIQKITEHFFTYLEENNIDLKGYWFGTGIGMDIPEYAEFIKVIQEKFAEKGIQPDDWVKMHIGATIGVHTGPYPMGLGILKKCDV